MTSFPPVQKESQEFISAIRFDSFEVSCAGSSPLTAGGFVFGSDDGRILFTDTQGAGHGPAILAATSNEAINSLAFLDPWMAVSTRQDVTFLRIGSGYEDRFDCPCGAHQIIAGSSGCFYAAGGNTGIMSAQPEPGAKLRVTFRRSKS